MRLKKVFPGFLFKVTPNSSVCRLVMSIFSASQAVCVISDSWSSIIVFLYFFCFEMVFMNPWTSANNIDWCTEMAS